MTDTAPTPLVRAGALVAVLLFLAKGIYVAIELVYNHTLIEFVGSRYLTEQQVENIELFGRNLAATGMTLLLLPLFIALIRRHLHGFRAWTTLALLVSGTYFSVYKAQEAVIEHLAESAPAQARYDAYYLNMMRGLLARGDIVHERFLPARSESAELSYEDKLALLVLPLAVSGDSALIDQMRQEGATALSRFLREDALRSRFANDWEHYHQLQGSLVSLWGAYQQIVVAGQKASTTNDAATAYVRAYRQAADRYGSYHALSATYTTQTKLRLSERNMMVLRDRLAAYFAAPAKDKNAKYVAATQDLFMYQPENPQRWCSETPRRCPGDLAHIRKEAGAIFLAAFKRNTNGVPPGLSSDAFLRHPAVTKAVAQAVAAEGISLPASFDGTFSAFARAHQQAVKDRVQGELDRAMEPKLGQALPVGLDTRHFLQHEAVTAMLPIELRGRPLFLDLEGFFRQVWAPAAEERIAAAQAGLLPGKADIFAEGEWKTVGTKAVKMLYILPLAMGLSALMSLLNLATMLTAAAMLAYTVIRRQSPVRGMAVGATLGLLLAMPFLLPGGTNQAHAGVDLVGRYADDHSLVMGAGIDWLLQAEGLVYRLGRIAVDGLPVSGRQYLADLFGG